MTGRRKTQLRSFLALTAAAALFPASTAAQQVTVEQVLKYRPTQPDVEYDVPPADDVAKCKVEVEKEGSRSGWRVLGPQGQVIRRFVDSDGNGFVDHYRYYQHGLEVYRDIDTDGDKKVDECRWLNTGGTRWGIDSNQDGKIDRWKRISAEEASREAIRAIVTGNAAALSAVLLNEEDVRALKMDEKVGEQLLEAVASPGEKLQQLTAGSKVLTRNTRWVRFDTSMLMPNLIPAESGKAAEDLEVYENVMAIVQTGGETGFVQIGEMVRVGDVWKLTSLPRPLEGDSLEVTQGGVLMQPSVTAAVGALELSPEVQKLIEELRELDENAPGPSSSAAAAARYNVRRAELLGGLAAAAGDAEEREQWLRQQIDGIAAATQMNAFPDGLEELKSVEADLRKDAEDSPLVAYVVYRRLLAEYNTRLAGTDAEQRDDVQEWWVTSLEEFIENHRQADDVPEAMLQLAVTHEFSGKLADARQWYEALVRQHRTAPPALRANGALRRLGLVGKPLSLEGSALAGGSINTDKYRGRVLLVIFWATWCQPCTEDLPQIQALYQQYQREGFEVLGVNLDSPGAPIQEYIRQHKVAWPHVHEEGGLDSRPAVEFGIISVPTMILTDRQGRVVSVSASVEELKEKVPELLKAGSR